MAYLAIASWSLGEVDRAISLIDRMQRRIADLTHVGTLAFGRMHAALFDLMRGDHARAAPNVSELARFAREHELPTWRAFAPFLRGWATAADGAPDGGLEDMRRGVDLLREQNVLLFDGLFKIALAEAEARAGDPDRAVAILDEALATCDRLGRRAFEAELHRARGEILLKRDPANPAPAEEAMLTAIAVARRQTTRSFELRAALSLAKLYQSTGRLADAHGVLAPALEGFAPTPEMPEIAEAEALLAALAETDEVKTAGSERQRRVDLQTSFAQALMWSKGFTAEETKTAFDRIEFTARTENAPVPFAVYEAQLLRSLSRGEFRQARETAEVFLRQAEASGRATEISSARRMLGLIALYQGDPKAARSWLLRALADYVPERDEGNQFVFGRNTEVSTAAFLSITEWHLGEVQRARQLIDQAIRDARKLDQVGPLANALLFKTSLECRRDDVSATRHAAGALLELVNRHGIKTWSVVAQMFANWARGRLDDPEAGASELRRALADYMAQGNKGGAPWYHGLLAELEAATRGPDSALALIDQGLAIADATGGHLIDPYLHRLRGEILLRGDPVNPASAEDAFRTAIAIAQKQGSRSFGLRAALSLAKLYQSTSRPADAHAVLAPALENFAPTPEMPEIAEAQTLLALLAAAEEVKIAIAQRQRRLDLQTSYGRALSWSKGFAAEETNDAFARVGEFAGPAESAAARFVAYDAQCLRSFMRGEYARAREIAETFLLEAEADGCVTEAGVARRMLGLIRLYQGDLKAARSILDRALSEYVPERDGEGFPAGDVNAAAFLALTAWHSGKPERARRLIQQAIRRADQLAHVTTSANALFFGTILESRRDDVLATLLNAEALVKLSNGHSMKTYLDEGQVYANWARGRLFDPEVGARELRCALEAYIAQGNKADVPSFHGFLAELETATDGALTLIDRGLTIAEETGEHFTDAYLHRLRGEILLRRDPANSAPAEEALQTAISIAKQQGARSYELLASLSLAKLYQASGRPSDAYTVLAPALEGFTSTPEMPEIAEAQGLLAEVAQ